MPAKCRVQDSSRDGPGQSRTCEVRFGSQTKYLLSRFVQVVLLRDTHLHTPQRNLQKLIMFIMLHFLPFLHRLW